VESFLARVGLHWLLLQTSRASNESITNHERLPSHKVAAVHSLVQADRRRVLQLVVGGLACVFEKLVRVRNTCAIQFGCDIRLWRGITIEGRSCEAAQVEIQVLIEGPPMRPIQRCRHGLRCDKGIGRKLTYWIGLP
jgi:hypothetical protein